MVRGVAVNHVYGVKTYGGSSPSHRANLLVGTRVVAGGGLLILWRKPAAGSNPALSAKSLTERAYFPPVVQVVTLPECSAVWSSVFGLDPKSRRFESYHSDNNSV